ncbi:hypothetical protein PO124_26565 [Bacillus licheniformis]|nr:hypothetical protein [Bacillus licheniformis]
MAVTQSEQILAIREWASLRAVSAARQEDLKEYQSIQLKKDDEIRVIKMPIYIQAGVAEL